MTISAYCRSDSYRISANANHSSEPYHFASTRPGASAQWRCKCTTKNATCQKCKSQSKFNHVFNV